VLYDIGSGLGKAGMFFGAFTPVKRVIGVEIEPEYADFANKRTYELGLSHVSFENRDVLEADLSAGTAFYFYNPFASTAERDALGMLADQLREIGAQKRIQIAVKGPGMQALLRESGAFSEETVLEEPAIWTVFRSNPDAR
jgi:protein-L-isoaspartate O-methyltransferase